MTLTKLTVDLEDSNQHKRHLYIFILFLFPFSVDVRTTVVLSDDKHRLF